MPNLREITWDEMESLQIDEETNELYWNNQKIVISKKLSLRRLELALAVFATVGTLMSGVAAVIELWMK